MTCLSRGLSNTSTSRPSAVPSTTTLSLLSPANIQRSGNLAWNLIILSTTCGTPSSWPATSSWPSKRKMSSSAAAWPNTDITTWLPSSVAPWTWRRGKHNASRLLNHSRVICRSGLYFLCHFLCLMSPSLVAWPLPSPLSFGALSPIHNPRFSPKIQENRPRGKKNRQNAWPYQKHSVSLHPLRPLYSILGEMAEWSNAPVLKTGVLQGTGGSNPSLSAKVSVTCCFTTRYADFLYIHRTNYGRF